MFFSSVKEINRLISKEMSNIYLNVTLEKNWRSQNFDFLSLKNLSLGQFFVSFNSRRYHWILKFLVATYKSEVWEQNCVWLFYYSNFERNYDALKSKTPCILLNKNINFNKNGTESEIPHTILERQTLCFSSYNNRKVKVKLRWVGARERKKRAFLYRLFCPKKIFGIFISMSVFLTQIISRRQKNADAKVE